MKTEVAPCEFCGIEFRDAGVAAIGHVPPSAERNRLIDAIWRDAERRATARCVVVFYHDGWMHICRRHLLEMLVAVEEDGDA